MSGSVVGIVFQENGDVFSYSENNNPGATVETVNEPKYLLVDRAPVEPVEEE